MNMPDGSVQIEAEGSLEQLQQLEAWCHEGSPLSKVEQVEASEGEIEGFDNFHVRQK